MEDEEMKKRIAESLQPLVPQRLDVGDDSKRHHTHKDGAKGHYSVCIVSSAFEGKTTLERHRLVYDLLRPWFGQGVHALKLSALTPEEEKSKQLKKQKSAG